MIYLSDAALVYAANICAEVDEYKVAIYISQTENIGRLIDKFKLYIRNSDAVLVPHCPRFVFANKSTIDIIHQNYARGYRYNEAIVSQRLTRQEIDTLVRPSYIRHSHDKPEPPPINVADVVRAVDLAVDFSSVDDTISLVSNNLATTTLSSARSAVASNIATQDELEVLRERIRESEERISEYIREQTQQNARREESH